MKRSQSIYHPISQFGGLQIIYSEAALAETTERLFPESKNRSKRILKKLIKRFGGEYKKTPAMFKDNKGRIFCHPAYRSKLEAALKDANNDKQA